MKTNKIWIVIVLILAAGIGSTTYTKQYVSSMPSYTSEMPEADKAAGAAADMTEAAAAEAAPAVQAAGAAEAAIVSDSGAVAAAAAPAPIQEELPETAADEAGGVEKADERSVNDGSAETSGMSDSGAADSRTADSRTADSGAADSGVANGASESAGAETGSQDAQPLTGTVAVEENARPEAAVQPDTASLAPAATSETAADPGTRIAETTAGACLQRLQELDAQIEKNRQAASDTTANSLKAAAENERKLWEQELQRILDTLEQRLPTDQKDQLFQEEKDWIRSRENRAVEASKKQSGSAMEEVEYNVSLAESTRARSYELAEAYASVLAGTE